MIRTLYVLAALLCTSATFAQADVSRVGDLPAAVNETSGLIFFNGKLITHNDSGNAARLFELDSLTLAISRTITISNATNVDWEDLAQDDDYIYIGDFGNNAGDRTDLVIYRVSKAEYLASDTVMADRIEFSYADQTDFTPAGNSDWDAEAMVSLGDNLLIFTKEWKRNGTIAYAVPRDPGEQIASKIGTYDTGGLITGATFNPLAGTLILLGYSHQLQPFVIDIAVTGEEFNFSGVGSKSILNIGYAQAEGITYVNKNRYFITSEFFSTNNPPIILAAGLYVFTTPEGPGDEETPGEGENPEPGQGGKALVLYKPFGSQQLQYELRLPNVLFGRAIFDTSGRLIRYTHGKNITGSTMDLSGLPAAVYYLTFFLEGHTLSAPFVAN